MAAASTDKNRKKRSNFSTTLNGAIGSSDTTINLSSTSGLPTDTAVTVTIDRVDSNGNSTPTKMERVVGVVSSNQLLTCTRGVDNSPSAQAHSSGAVVEDIWDALSWNDHLTAYLLEHNQAGIHNIPTSSLVSQYAVDGGSANVYSVTLSPVPTLVTGMVVAFKAANANTLASTLNVNALGATAIKKADGATALVANDIKAGQIVTVRYDGTNFQMTSPSANGATDAGLSVSDVTTNNVSTSAHGFMVKAPNDKAQKFQGDATWVADTGWINSSDTFVYASASSFTISGVDRTTVFTKGTRIKLTNNSTTYYGVVLSSSFSTNTTVNLVPNNDYSLANSAITNPAYSYAINPQGYPTWFNFTPVFSTQGTAFTNAPTSNSAIFSVEGNKATIIVRYTYNATSGGTAATVLTIPFTPAITNQAGWGWNSSAGFILLVATNGTNASILTDKYDGSTAIANSNVINASIILQF